MYLDKFEIYFLIDKEWVAVKYDIFVIFAINTDQGLYLWCNTERHCILELRNYNVILDEIDVL